jgi:hypothetical protein
MVPMHHLKLLHPSWPDPNLSTLPGLLSLPSPSPATTSPTLAAQKPQTLAIRQGSNDSGKACRSTLLFPRALPLLADVYSVMSPHPHHPTSLMMPASANHWATPPPAPARCPASSYKRASPSTPFSTHHSSPSPDTLPRERQPFSLPATRQRGRTTSVTSGGR